MDVVYIIILFSAPSSIFVRGSHLINIPLYILSLLLQAVTLQIWIPNPLPVNKY